MNFDYPSIEEKLSALIKQIPTPSEFRNDLFTISGNPHYETVLSNWFAYFLESETNTGLSAVFTRAISKALNKLQVSNNLDWLEGNIHVKAEYFTDKGNYIDLVVYDFHNEENDTYENSLIIEHKVEAALYNDLQDYYESVKTVNSKQGVVLSAKPFTDINNPNYMNVIYEDLIDALKKELGSEIQNISSENLQYFKDFINNLERMSDTKNTEALKFCFEHGEAIKKIAAVKKESESDLCDIMKLAVTQTDFIYYRAYPNSISFRAADDTIVFILEISQLYSDRQCKFQYWLNKDGAQAWHKVPSHKELEKAFPQYEIREKKDGKEWVEILRGNIDLTTVNNIADNFAPYIVDYLNNEIKQINTFVLNQIAQYK